MARGRCLTPARLAGPSSGARQPALPSSAPLSHAGPGRQSGPSPGRDWAAWRRPSAARAECCRAPPRHLPPRASWGTLVASITLVMGQVPLTPSGGALCVGVLGLATTACILRLRRRPVRAAPSRPPAPAGAASHYPRARIHDRRLVSIKTRRSMPPGRCAGPRLRATLVPASGVRSLPWMLGTAAMARDRRHRGCGSSPIAPSA
jgi:hypothetical protein